MTDSIQSTFGVNAPFSASEYGTEYPIPGAFSETLIAGETLPFGRAVVWDISGGADDKETARIPSTTGEVTTATFGVTLKDQTRRANTGYLVNAPARVMRRGRVRVQVDQTVVRGDPVFVRFGAGGSSATVFGVFRKDADTNGAVALPGAVFAEGGTSTTGAVLELNLPSGTLTY
jgi:hypothetical protein